MSRIYKEYFQLTYMYYKSPTLKIGEMRYLHRHFTKGNIQMINKLLNRCMTSLVLKEMQIKTQIRYHFIFNKIVLTKKTATNTGKNMKKPESHILLVGK